MKPKLGIVVPTYGHLDYAEAAIASAYAETTKTEPLVCVVDDGTPEWPEDWFADLKSRFPGIVCHRSAVNHGLHTAWNRGLRLAARHGCDYGCATNSDVLFTPGWDEALVAGLDYAALVGPVTNAPGTEEAQFVGRYSGRYRRSDEPEVLEAVAQELAGRREVLPGAVNGFCLFAKMTTWRQYAASQDPWLPFRPRVEHDSRGRPNPTPTLTLGEYDFQGRLRAHGRIAAVCPGSYVFHYRSVTRGEQHRRGHWLRAEKNQAATFA